MIIIITIIMIIMMIMMMMSHNFGDLTNRNLRVSGSMELRVLPLLWRPRGFRRTPAGLGRALHACTEGSFKFHQKMEFLSIFQL